MQFWENAIKLVHHIWGHIEKFRKISKKEVEKFKNSRYGISLSEINQWHS